MKEIREDDNSFAESLRLRFVANELQIHPILKLAQNGTDGFSNPY